MILQMILFCTGVVGWAIFSVRKLLSNQKKKEAWIYCALLGGSLVIGTLLIAQVNIPNLIAPFNLLFEPWGKMFLQ